MAKNPLNRKVAREIQMEAEQIARSLQTPDQTREQTRLIARGIQRGIETYRRQQAEKARDFDRELKKLKKLNGIWDLFYSGFRSCTRYANFTVFVWALISGGRP